MFGTEWSSMKSAALKAKMLCFCAISRSGCLGDTSILWESIWHVWANCVCFPVSMWNPGLWCVSSACSERYPAFRPDVTSVLLSLAIQIATYELLFYSAFESPALTAVMPVLALEVQDFLGSVYVQGPRAVRSRKMHVSDCMAPQPNAAGWCFCKPGLSPAQGVGVHIPTSVLQEGSHKLDSFLRSAISPSQRESVPSSVWQQGVFWRLWRLWLRDVLTGERLSAAMRFTASLHMGNSHVNS